MIYIFAAQHPDLQRQVDINLIDNNAVKSHILNAYGVQKYGSFDPDTSKRWLLDVFELIMSANERGGIQQRKAQSIVEDSQSLKIAPDIYFSWNSFIDDMHRLKAENDAASLEWQRYLDQLREKVNSLCASNQDNPSIVRQCKDILRTIEKAYNLSSPERAGERESVKGLIDMDIAELESN